MRLTGGLDKGRKLRAPRGLETRPTAARVREAIFNILGPPEGLAVLDLYAGTGALGLESLSRGAARAVFVERGHRACEALRANVKALGFAGRAQVLPLDARAGLRHLQAAGERFDWVFVDPPYAAGETSGVLDEICGGGLLSEGAVVVVEHDRRHRPPERAAALLLTDHRVYGDTELSFYRAGRS